MKKTIALLIFLVAYVHSYTGNYCNKDKSICIQINPGGKAELVVNKVNIIGSYTKNGDNFLVTPKTAANPESKNLIVKKIKKELESSEFYHHIFDRRKELDNCNSWVIEHNGKYSYSGTRGGGFQSRDMAVYECLNDREKEISREKQQAASKVAANQKRIKELKYSNELIGEIMPLEYNFILVGNTLHSPDGRCRSGLALTKLGSKESAFNDYDEDKQFCKNNVVYNKCGGEIYEPDKQGCCGGAVYDSATQLCENNTLLLKCGNGWYDEKKQFCSSGNILKDYGKLTDSRDGKTYKTVAIGSQTWMAQNLDYKGKEYSWEQAKTVCPVGWHLPSVEEWQALVNFAGGEDKLIAKTKGGKGTDEYGFSADGGRWWTATKDHNNYVSGTTYAYIVNISGAKFTQPQAKPLSVRCVQGAPDPKDAPKTQSGTAAAEEGKMTYGGQTYKTVKIGDQVWMAENLNYKAKGSECYDSKPENCGKYGRLYDWNMARSACPGGWHLPFDTEWQTLVDFAGGEKVAGGKLKANNGWDEDGNGTDEYGFSALPGGNGPPKGGFDLVGIGGYFWSATENNSKTAYGRSMKRNGTNVTSNNFIKSVLISVRCIQD